MSLSQGRAELAQVLSDTMMVGVPSVMPSPAACNVWVTIVASDHGVACKHNDAAQRAAGMQTTEVLQCFQMAESKLLMMYTSSDCKPNAPGILYHGRQQVHVA